METFKLSYLILSLGAIQGLLLSFFLLESFRRKGLPNLLLGLVLLLFSFNMLIPGILFNYYEVFYYLLGVGFPLMFLFGPGVYFYTLLKTGSKTTLSTKDVAHLLPFFISLVISIPLFMESPETKILMLEEWRQGVLSSEILIGWTVECVHLSVYMVLSHRVLAIHQKKVRDLYSSPEKLDLKWLSQFVGINSLVWFFYALTLVAYAIGLDSRTYNVSFLLFGFSVSFLTYYLAYQGLRHPEAFINGTKKDKYQKSGMSSQMLDIYEKQLDELMEKEQPYLSPDLTLPGLAKKIGIPTNYLSQVINERKDSNFFDYINSHRVAEARQRLKNPAHEDLPIIQVAYSVGFNSKSTFNAAFKKFSKTTPTDYRKALSESLPHQTVTLSEDI